MKEEREPLHRRSIAAASMAQHLRGIDEKGLLRKLGLFRRQVAARRIQKYWQRERKPQLACERALAEPLTRSQRLTLGGRQLFYAVIIYTVLAVAYFLPSTDVHLLAPRVRSLRASPKRIAGPD
jgi:hypothetical protein